MKTLTRSMSRAWSGKFIKINATMVDSQTAHTIILLHSHSTNSFSPSSTRLAKSRRDPQAKVPHAGKSVLVESPPRTSTPSKGDVIS